jgi:hypothetical protein
MEFPDDIDPSQFLDHLNWDVQDNDEGDGNHQRRESLDKSSEFSCDLGVRRETDDGRSVYPWDILLGAIDDGTKEKEEDGEDLKMPAGDGGSAANEQLQYQQKQPQSMTGSNGTSSYESTMGGDSQRPQHAQPHLLTHPLAMTSLSSCPSFPLPNSSSNSGHVTVGNGNSSGGSSSNLSQEIPLINQLSSIPQSSIVSGASSSNANSSQPGSQTSGSNGITSSSSSSSNLFNTQYPLLPSWNDSMGDFMYSPLFNIGMTNTAATTTSSNGTPVNPFQCTPLNSVFASNNFQQSHYGMAINGFHPQVNATVNPVLPLNGPVPHVPTRAGTTSPGTVKTSNAGKSTTGDASVPVYRQQQQMKPPAPQQPWSYKPEPRQKEKKTSNERNEREQQRVKKITQLIQEIKSSMEAEGWKEEMKSKYETLSQ